MLNVLGGEGREREVLLYRSPSVFFKLLFSSLPPQWIVAVECIEGVGPQFRPPFSSSPLFLGKVLPLLSFPHRNYQVSNESQRKDKRREESGENVFRVDFTDGRDKTRTQQIKMESYL